MAVKERTKAKREDMCHCLKTMQVSTIWVFLQVGNGGKYDGVESKSGGGSSYAPKHMHRTGWTHVHAAMTAVVSVSVVTVIHGWWKVEVVVL